MYKIFVASLLFLTSVFGADKLEKLVLSGPFASVAHPLAYIVENGTLKDIADKVEFRLWKNPDELRALSMQGGADFIAVPTNVGANLYNKGVKIQLLNVSVWGILGMVSRDENLKSLKDFKGKEVVVPFRADMPDIVLRVLLKKEGLDPKKDITLKYVSTPMDAMQMLIIRQADHVLLAEPAISMALRKTKSFPINVIAPTIFRSVDLQNVWGEAFQTKPQIPQAGIAQIGSHDPYITKRFLEEYKKALQWYKKNPKQAGELTQKYFPMLQSEAVANSIAHIKLYDVSATDAKEELEFFYQILYDDNPKLIGGKLPNSGFYFQP